MKKTKIFLPFATLALAFGLFGCNDAASSAAPSSSKAPATSSVAPATSSQAQAASSSEEESSEEAEEGLVVQVEDGTSENDAITFKTSHNVDTLMVDAWPQNAVLTLTFAAENAGAYEMHLFARAHGGYTSTNTDVVADTMEITMNGAPVTLEGEVDGGTFTDYKIGEVTLVKGNNTMTVKSLVEDGNMTTIDLFRFVEKA